YEILAPLGAGGMGEVYRARDTRLEREVAVKVLPAHLSSSEEMRQRFEREARAISQLSHPHICALYDVGSHEGTEYLVMELLEGETLAARLVKGPLPTEQLLRLGVEIADALDKAHRQGIVHRDLKPGNVMLTKSGVKLLDFGLAKAFPSPPGRGQGEGLTSLPTMAGAQNLTQEGTILGTFQYMAPEQLEGKEADARSDIFAFGGVLYEMATGKKAFSGKSQASLIASILEREPPAISSVAPMTPPALDRVVKTCLAKDPDERWQTAHDVRLQLAWIAEGGSQAGVPAPVASRRKSRERLAWTIATAALLAAAGLAWLAVRGARRPEPVFRSSIPAPEGAAFWLEQTTPGPAVLSPDGRKLAFKARDAAGKAQIYVRPLDAPEPRALTGTDDAVYPFWSPDGRSLGFFAGGKLKTIEADGGPPVTLCAAPDGKGGTWSPAGIIVFAPSYNTPLSRVAVGGGEPVAITKFDAKRGDDSHRHPRFLPDGRHFLYLARVPNAALEGHAVLVGSLDGGPEKLLLRSPAAVEYAAGYILFLRERTLMARPFDAKRLAFTADPFPLAEKVLLTSVSAAIAVFSASQNGVLVYQTARGDPTSQLAWLGRDGSAPGVLGEAGDYLQAYLSPDGKHATAAVRDQGTGNRDLWVFDVARNLRTRFTFGPANSWWPVWSPDSASLAFASSRKGHLDLYRKPLGGSSEEELLYESKADKMPMSISPDGRFLAYFESTKETRGDIWILPLQGERKPQLFLQTPFFELPFDFSPDGRWLSYGSDESGKWQVYVTSFPRPARKWQVSTEESAYAHWRADGKELVFQGIAGQLWAVEVAARGDDFQIGAQKLLFKFNAIFGPSGYDYFPTADHQRFLVLNRSQQPNLLLDLVVNWPASVRRAP
ncbi:MAG: protein kinase domain-containing protein, partial [Thermoanaerobaculia bacterium]